MGLGDLPERREDLGGVGFWLGETVTGATRMGIRIYDPTTGRFLSVDPVPGGSASAYEYCRVDPVNNYDLDGKSWWRGALKYSAIGAGIVSAIACGATIVCGIAEGAAAGAGATLPRTRDGEAGDGAGSPGVHDLWNPDES
ncbi:RHS repeat-associated protein [Streptomyces sp. SAI-135]|uniref:RHS repeat-associated core domain-containing protein n=1 Tax=unclassified Streptomyces TaxID=2593676 RepID=UPI002474B351|nr:MULTISPECIES: RHS repeat-associated core domain-containing protein [unclassified Streptomyces]MDH6522525.1 RHS repeat-associated protein [Streptomyces sp. SAI-090]MDH6554146.1 RHS repeat-associated protein [Streptomyces sp. SAI-041]MDH6573410.1 RHS repeat-associated protein [Streptomyces sp. SAI-117]MDH6581836.1 RHS repeat-associated protein [Streptomyces sp. SAI-133]MDH6590108.1 RHS repeat-associated protein [Streptomyces sp. SAI-133]